MSVSIATLGFIRRMIIAFGLMVFIPLLVMAYVHLRGEQVSFPMVLISTALASSVGFYVVWEMVNRVLTLVQDVKQYAPEDTRQDESGVLEQSFSRLIQQMQGNMAELETKARLLEETEQRLGEANVYSAQIIAAIADFVIVTDPQMQVTKANAAIQAVLGYKVDDLKDRPIETVLRGTGGGDKLLAQHELDELTKVGTLWGKSGMLRSRDGEGIPVQMNLSLVTHSNGQLDGIVIVARDVRETLRLVADLQQAKATLEERVRQRTLEIEQALREREKADLELTRKDDQLIRQDKMASLGQLAAGVAHEINNPVDSSAATSKCYRRTSEFTHYVERTNSMVGRLSDLGLPTRRGCRSRNSRDGAGSRRRRKPSKTPDSRWWNRSTG
jgi:PAS domain S-box-containing protein